MNIKTHFNLPPFRRSQVIVPLMVASALLGADLASAGTRTHRDPHATGAMRLKAQRPDVDPKMSSADRWAFQAAFNTAVERVDGYRACGDLFADLHLRGIEALRAARYEPARSPSDLARCEGEVAAVTSVHGRRTRLCYRFKVLSKTDRAAILIHEALHVAGLSEWPRDPEAPTSREITERVKGACAL